MKISTKLRVFSDRFFACSHGVGRGVHRGADGEGGRLGNSGVGATAWWGGGAIVGVPAGRDQFIPFLKTKSQKRQTKIVQSKNRINRTDSTNTIATNFV